MQKRLTFSSLIRSTNFAEKFQLCINDARAFALHLRQCKFAQMNFQVKCR